MLAVLSIWAVGMPIAYCLDSDPTGTRWDRLVGAAMWPLVVLVIGAMLAAGAAILGCHAITRLWRLLPC